MAVKIVPMDSTHPKTPSWAFTRPDLVKNSKSYGLCHFSPSSSATCAPFCTSGWMKPSSECFRLQNPAPMHVPQITLICQTVTRNIAPEHGGVGCMGRPYGHVARAKGTNRPPIKPGLAMWRAHLVVWPFWKTKLHTKPCAIHQNPRVTGRGFKPRKIWFIK
jgi:hypothetical protein